MRPTSKQLHVDPVLTKLSVAYQPQAFLAGKIMPDVTVEKKSGIYFRYDRSMFRLSEDVRASGTKSNVVEWGLIQDNYGPVVEHSLKAKVTDEMLEEYPNEFDAFQDAAQLVKNMIFLNREKSLADYMSNTANITQNETLSGSSQFSDYANSNPIAKIDVAKNTIRSSIMRAPNTMIVGYAVDQVLRHHPDFLERFKYSERGILTDDHLKLIFGVQNYWVADQQYVTSDQGQTETIADIWGKHMWIGYIDPIVQKKSITFGFHFTYARGVTTDRWYDEDESQTWVRTKFPYVREVVANEAMFLYKNVVA